MRDRCCLFCAAPIISFTECQASFHQGGVEGKRAEEPVVIASAETRGVEGDAVLFATADQPGFGYHPGVFCW